GRHRVWPPTSAHSSLTPSFVTPRAPWGEHGSPSLTPWVTPAGVVTGPFTTAAVVGVLTVPFVALSLLLSSPQPASTASASRTTHRGRCNDVMALLCPPAPRLTPQALTPAGGRTGSACSGSPAGTGSGSRCPRRTARRGPRAWCRR